MSRESPAVCRFTSDQVKMIRSMTNPVVRFENDMMQVVDEGAGAPTAVTQSDQPVWFTIVAGLLIFVLLPLSCGVGMGIARMGYDAVTK